MYRVIWNIKEHIEFYGNKDLRPESGLAPYLKCLVDTYEELVELECKKSDDFYTKFENKSLEYKIEEMLDMANGYYKAYLSDKDMKNLNGAKGALSDVEKYIEEAKDKISGDENEYILQLEAEYNELLNKIKNGKGVKS